MSAAAPLREAVRAQTAVELRLTARRGENILALVGLPVGLLIAFTLGAFVDLGVARPVEALLPASIALAIVAAGLVNLGIATAYERSYGVLRRLGVSPLGRAGLVAAKVIATAAIVGLQLIALVAVAGLALGWEPPAESSPLVTLAAVGLGTTLSTAAGLLLAGMLRAEATLALANTLFVTSALFGGIVVPAATLPAPADAAVALLPTAALADALRTGFGVGGADPVGPLLVLLGWTVVVVLAAVRTFRWD